MALWAGHQLNTALARGQPALKKTTPQHLWAMCEPSAVYCFQIFHSSSAKKKDQEGLGPSLASIIDPTGSSFWALTVTKCNSTTFVTKNIFNHILNSSTTNEQV